MNCIAILASHGNCDTTVQPGNTLNWKRLANLYCINNKRLNEFDRRLPLLPQQSVAFQKEHDELVEKTESIVRERDPAMQNTIRKILTQHCWKKLYASNV